MPRKRKHGVELPPHTHRVTSKGNVYYFYQAFRGTSRQGQRFPLPRDPKSPEFWDAAMKLAGTVPGYSGTIAAMIDAYRSSPEFQPPAVSKNTQRIYNLYLDRARIAIGAEAPDAIRPAHIIALRDQYRDTPRAADSLVAALRACYTWGRPRDFCINNPCSKLPKLAGGGQHRPWPQPMVDLLIEHARWEVRRFVLLTLHTGQREGDVCRMALSDIEDGSIRVVQEKTGKELWIPISATLQPVIDEARAAGGDCLIPRGNGEPFTANQFRALWGREMKRDVLKPIREAGLVPHGLCKNAHNLLFEAGNSNKEVGSVTGRSPTMVEYYGRAANQKALAKTAVKRAENAAKVLQTGVIP